MGDYHYPPVDPSLGDGSATFADSRTNGSENKKRRMGSQSPDEDDPDVKPLTGKDAPGGKGGASEFVKKLYRSVLPSSPSSPAPSPCLRPSRPGPE